MRISDWSSDVCSSDLRCLPAKKTMRCQKHLLTCSLPLFLTWPVNDIDVTFWIPIRILPQPSLINCRGGEFSASGRSEEHTSELQSLMRISYAVIILKKNNTNTTTSLTSTHLCRHT